MNAKLGQARRHLMNDELLAKFMPLQQRLSLREQLEGEEGDFFVQKVLEIADIIRGTPVTYGTEDVDTEDKVLRLHYFMGGVDAWIVERDVGDTPAENGEGEQIQAYGKCTLFGGGWREAEWGYISIQKLIENGVELDLYWTPRTCKEMK